MEFGNVGEYIRLQICESLSSGYLEFIVCLDVFSEPRIDIPDCVVEDVVLEAGTNSFISCLWLVVVVLDDLTYSGCVGCNVRLDLLIESCWCHCLRLVFDLGEVEEVDSRHSEVVVPFYQVEDPGE